MKKVYRRSFRQPCKFVLVDQFIDHTKKRVSSFFESGVVAHVSMASPVCHRLKSHIFKVSEATQINIANGGTYITIEGPQFSTYAESNLYKKWGCDVVGMTNMPEAKLAREAEICYTSVAMVTDFDCWHPEHENVSVEQIVKTLSANEINARKLLKAVFKPISEDGAGLNCSCRKALDNAIITVKESRDPQQVDKLKIIAARIL
jgi:5'-methylthioadenosine phosphorylase